MRAEIAQSEDQVGYGLDDREIGAKFPTGIGEFTVLHSVQTSSGAHPISYPTLPREISVGEKRPRRKADCSHPYFKLKI
jgi:hypothetical protein